MHDTYIRKLLTPSWLSSFIGAAVGILVTGAAMILSRYQGSELQQQIFENQANAATAVSSSSAYDKITANIADNSFLGGLPLLLTWAAVGLVVYYFAIAIARSFGEAASLHQQLGYVHSSRQVLVRKAVINLVIRSAAAIGWFMLIKLTVSIFVPYALAVSSLASRSLSLQNVGYAVLSIVLLFVVIQVHAVFLRVLVLRPRVFTR